MPAQSGRPIWVCSAGHMDLRCRFGTLVPEGLGKHGQLQQVPRMQHPFQREAIIESDLLYAIMLTREMGPDAHLRRASLLLQFKNWRSAWRARSPQPAEPNPNASAALVGTQLYCSSL